MTNSGINWIFYAPQFHVGIAFVAVVCLGLNVATFRIIRKIAKKVGLND
jgi:hypothetical protein